MKKLLKVAAILLIAAFAFSSCAAGANPYLGQPRGDSEPAGFFQGLWHGCIAVITFVISLFDSGVNVYEVHNAGGWYNFGFIIGLSVAFGGSGAAGMRAKRWRKDED
jgi:hypothetical protein